MQDSINKVLEFHKTYQCFIQDFPDGVLPPDKEAQLKDIRLKLIREETDELETAMAENDIVEIGDALGDLLYVVYGTAITYGLQNALPEIFNHIHDSNMSKLGLDGKPIFREDGKVLKGPNY